MPSVEVDYRSLRRAETVDTPVVRAMFGDPTARYYGERDGEGSGAGEQPELPLTDPDGYMY